MAHRRQTEPGPWSRPWSYNQLEPAGKEGLPVSRSRCALPKAACNDDKANDNSGKRDNELRDFGGYQSKDTKQNQPNSNQCVSHNISFVVSCSVFDAAVASGVSDVLACFPFNACSIFIAFHKAASASRVAGMEAQMAVIAVSLIKLIIEKIWKIQSIDIGNDHGI